MKNNSMLKHLLFGAGGLFLCALLSCVKTVYIPEPSENPIYLTSEAQTKDTWVKYMFSIGAENPKMDTVEFNNVQTATQNLWIKIHNDWITLDEGGTLPKEVIRITVKENTSPYSRSYVVTSHSHLAETKIAIIQAGKS